MARAAWTKCATDLGIPIPDGDYVTLGGFLFDAFGRIPEEGETLEFCRLDLPGDGDGPEEGRQGRRAGASGYDDQSGRRRAMTVSADGKWRSLAARSVRDAEVAGSNPAFPTHATRGRRRQTGRSFLKKKEPSRQEVGGGPRLQ